MNRFIDINNAFPYFIIFGLILLLSSCNKDESNEDLPLLSGEMVAVNFSVSVAEFGENEVVTRKEREAPLNPTQVGRFISPFGEDAESLYVYASLEEDQSVSLRSGDEVSLRSLEGSAVRIVAYNNSGGFVDYVDCLVTGTGLVPQWGTSYFNLPEGDYKFVAFSFGNSNPPWINQPFQASMNNIVPTNDLMWGEFPVGNALYRVSSTSSSVQIEMRHLFSRVTIQFITTSGTFTANPGTIGIETYLANLAVRTGDMTPGANPPGPVMFTWPAFSASNSTLTSNPCFVNAGNSPITTVWINSVQIDGINHQLQLQGVRFDKALLPGVSYMLTVRFLKDNALDYDFAGSNIYWDGVGLTFDPAGVREREQYQGVYFQWGSLVGLSPVPYFFFPNGKHYVPEFRSVTADGNYTGSEWSATSTFYNTWGAIPFWNSNNILYMISLNNYFNKHGDICKYLGDTGAAPRGYRMPNPSDFVTTGTWYNGSATPVNDSGTTRFGTGYLIVKNGKETFFPASGSRMTDGKLNTTDQINYWTTNDVHGAYWSSFGSSDLSNGMMFNAAGFTVLPVTRTQAMPVRCIKGFPAS